MAKPDMVYENWGILGLLRPISFRAANRLHESVDPDAFQWSGALVCEPRYAPPILHGAVEQGLVVWSVAWNA